MDNNWNNLINKAKEFNINLTDNQIRQFQEYWGFLYEYNKHTNMVSSAEPDLVVSKHFADSLAIGLLQDYLNLNSVSSFLDVGIGGGFPGIPITIAFPELNLCAVDSIGKKTKFLSLLAEKLGITTRVEIINARAEDFIKTHDKRESFDFSVARAVSRLNVLLEYTMPFIKVGGYFAAYKAKTFQEEIDEAKFALSVLGGEVVKIANYTLCADSGENSANEPAETRNLILIKKVKPTPEKYPRKAGIPLKNPL